MAKRQPFDTNLSFPPAPTRALLNTPLDGIIGGPAPRPEPPAVVALREADEYAAPPIEPQPALVEPVAVRSQLVEDTERQSSASRATIGPDVAQPGATAASVGRTEPADDGKVTVKLPTDLKNRLYNAIYAERGTVGDYLTRAVEDLIDQMEQDRGGPYPQRPPADVKFRAGRRPR